jgi:hypothetical protein
MYRSHRTCTAGEHDHQKHRAQADLWQGSDPVSCGTARTHIHCLVSADVGTLSPSVDKIGRFAEFSQAVAQAAGVPFVVFNTTGMDAESA